MLIATPLWKINIGEVQHLPCLTYPQFKGTFESMIFLFPRWDLLVPWRGCVLHCIGFGTVRQHFIAGSDPWPAASPVPMSDCSDYGKMGKDFQNWVPWVDKNSISFFFGGCIFSNVVRRFLDFRLRTRSAVHLLLCHQTLARALELERWPLERADSLDFHGDFYSTIWISSRFVGRSCIIKVWFCRSRSTRSNTSALFGQWYHIIS